MSTNQEAPEIPEAMVLEEKTPDLLALLIAHVRGVSPAVFMVPQPPTPASARASSGDATKKKRKKGKGSEGTKEGEIVRSVHQPRAKKPWTTRSQQKKSTPFGSSKGSEGDQRPNASILNLTFMMSLGDPVMDDTTLRDPQNGRSGILSKCLKKALLLPEDMHKL